MEMSEEAYKLAKEAHVADCTGGSINEISMVCASLVVSINKLVLFAGLTFSLELTHVVDIFSSI